jgi:hypothetical protein
LIYPAQYGFPTHKECTNFRNGICMLNGATVDPYGPICPSFMPKTTTDTVRTQRPSIVQHHNMKPETLRTMPPSQSPYPFSRQFSYTPTYTPYTWEAYGYPSHPRYPPVFMSPQPPYGYGITSLNAIPFPYPGYVFQAGYGYPLYPLSPYPMYPQLSYEELRNLEAYREDLKAEIESVNMRIRELRGRASQ